MPVYLQYYFWLIAVSLFCFLLERLWPWRKEQRTLRRGIWQDLFWLVFNGHYLGVLLAMVTGRLVQAFNGMLFEMGVPVPESLALVSSQPLWLQFVVFFVVKDFVEWNIHRLLHLTPWLWEFHKLHHSIEELDWIGNFRFHWGEVVVYKTLSYLPLVVLGVDGTVILLNGHREHADAGPNHSNLRIDWDRSVPVQLGEDARVASRRGAARERGSELRHRAERVGLDLPHGLLAGRQEQPERLGFEGMEETYPRSLAARLVYPFVKWRR